MFSEIETKESSITTILVFIGKGENLKYLAKGKCHRQHFRPFIGWELCHVVPFSVPDEYRFCKVEEVEKKEYKNNTIYALRISF